MARRGRRLADAAFALLVGGLAAAFHLLGATQPADEALYDRFATRLPAPAGMPEVVIVGIDEASFSDIGQPWPWPRGYHATLVERLRAAGASAIGYDVVFADPGPPEADAALAAAMGPDVVLAADLAVTETPQGQVAMAVRPLPKLLATGARPGVIAVPLDADGAVRRLPAPPDAFSRLLTGGAAAPAGARIRYAADGLRRVSFYQALEPEALLPPGFFAGHIVLVGLTLRTGPEAGADVFRTPFTARGGGLMPGVEVHAHALRTLAAGAAILPVPAFLVAALAVALAGAVSATIAGRPPGFAGAVAIGAAAATFAGAGAALLAGLWLPPVAPALAALGAGALQAALDRSREREARRQIETLFGRYLAPDLVARLAADPAAVKLGGERREVTILFCDLRGFTSLSERLSADPERLTAVVNAALTEIAEAVLAHGGLIDKFIGDCVMGLWNAPADDADHPAHAVAAGLAAIEKVEALSLRLEAEGLGVPLACGVGVNTGVCTVGNMGSAHRFDYTALGDAVNLASRLEAMTKEYGLPMLIGEATAARLPERTTVPLDLAYVRGRTARARLHIPAAHWPFDEATARRHAQALDAAAAGDLSGAESEWAEIAAEGPAAAAFVAKLAARAVPV